MTRASITITTEIDLDIKTGAKWFAGLSDDEMAQFFCAVAEESKNWPGPSDTMWCYTGRHLATCECSTEDGREMIRSIAAHMEHYLQQAAEPKSDAA